MRAAPILLDTCAAIWITERALVSAEAERELDDASAAGVPLAVSPMTAWEVGMLVSKGRVALAEDPKAWFAGLIQSGAELAEATPDILIQSSFLPSCSLRDPTDRIIAATARAGGYRLMTRDGPLLGYGRAGHMQVIAC